MKISIALLFAIITLDVRSQTPQKIGHADWEYIFSKMPEYKRIENEVKTFEAQLQNQLKSKGQEFEAKLKAYKELSATTPEAVKKDKESELTYLQENIQKFQQDAQASLQKKQTDLIDPVFVRVGKAIEAVAVENGFSYIINPQMLGGGDVLLFTDEQYNVSNLVLKKLGVDTPIHPTAPADKD
jgi:outer membrane protein